MWAILCPPYWALVIFEHLFVVEIHTAVHSIKSKCLERHLFVKLGVYININEASTPHIILPLTLKDAKMICSIIYSSVTLSISILSTKQLMMQSKAFQITQNKSLYPFFFIKASLSGWQMFSDWTSQGLWTAPAKLQSVHWRPTFWWKCHLVFNWEKMIINKLAKKKGFQLYLPEYAFINLSALAGVKLCFAVTDHISLQQTFSTLVSIVAHLQCVHVLPCECIIKYAKAVCE